ncbi:MAG: ABC transporter substrate-binding protein [Chloroflexi bacterium]|nr:ABC transporter substrate-binding protein [Chloroflexota bacterium]
MVGSDTMAHHQTTRRFVTLLLALLAMLVLTNRASAQELVIPPGEPLRVGVLLDGVDPTFESGHASWLGLALAVEERPALQIDGRNIDVDVLASDSACDAQAAAAIAARFAARGDLLAIIGPNCSSACQAAAPFFEEATLTSLSPSCTAPTLTEQGYASFHRLASNDRLLTERAARFLMENGAGDRIALLYSSDANPVFYQGLAAQMTAEIAARGGEIVSLIALTAATPFETLRTALETVAPQQLFCACEPEAAAALLAALADTPLEGLPLMGAELSWIDALQDLAPNAAEGTYVISGAAAPSAALAALEARLTERFGQALIEPYFSNAYDAYQLVLDTAAAVAILEEDGTLRIDRRAFRAAIRATQGYVGASGTFHCDARGDCLRSPSNIYQVQDGELILLHTYDD